MPLLERALGEGALRMLVAVASGPTFDFVVSRVAFFVRAICSSLPRSTPRSSWKVDVLCEPMLLRWHPRDGIIIQSTWKYYINILVDSRGSFGPWISCWMVVGLGKGWRVVIDGRAWWMGL